MLQWLNNNKVKVLKVLAILLLLPIGITIGRYAWGPKVNEKVVEKEVVRTVYQDRIVEKVVYKQVEKKKERTEITETHNPDGTKVVKTITDTDTDTNTDINKDRHEEKVVTQVIEKVVEKEKIIKTLPDWRVGVGVGYAIPTALGQPEIGVPGLKGAVIQAELDRRIIGTFALGVFGNTQGVAGLTFSGQW